MATKFYITELASPITTSNKGTWNQKNDIGVSAQRTKGSTPSTRLTAETSSTNNWTVLVLRACTEALPAQTISGTIDWVMGAVESSTNLNGFWALHVWVTIGDTDVARGTLLSNFSENTSNEFPTSAVGVGSQAPVSLSSVAIQAGDRIVIEIGFIARNTSATSMSATLNYGGSGSDTTVGGAATGATWFQFSQDLFNLPVTASDSLDNWSDALTKILELQLSFSDSINNLADALTKTLELRIVGSDSINNLTDALLKTLELRIAGSDSINNWLDAFSQQAVGLISASDSINNWADALTKILELRIAGSDSINNWLDAFSKQAVGLISASDSINNWSDAPVVVKGHCWSVSDSINNWADACVIRVGLAESLSDSINFWGDFAPLIKLDYDVTIVDTLNSWADALTKRGDGFLSPVESLNNWNDVLALVAGIPFSVSDTLNNWTDACFLVGNGRIPCSDTLNAWDDAVALQLGVPKSVAVTDSLNNWADAYTQQLLTGGIFLSLSDTLVFTDSIALQASYRLIISDTLNAWTDAIIQALSATQLSLFDDLNNFADSINLTHVLDIDVSSSAVITKFEFISISSSASILGISTVVDLDIATTASVNQSGSSLVDSSAVIRRTLVLNVETTAAILARPCFVSLMERAVIVVRGIAKLS